LSKSADRSVSGQSDVTSKTIRTQVNMVKHNAISFVRGSFLILSLNGILFT